LLTYKEIEIAGAPEGGRRVPLPLAEQASNQLFFNRGLSRH